MLVIRRICVLVALATSSSLLAVAPAAATAHSSVLLRTGASLHSHDGRFTATVTSYGHLVVRRGSTIVWRSRGPSGAHATLRLRPAGNLTLRSGPRLLWSAATAGSHANRLSLTNKGNLVLRSSGGTVWTSRAGNDCRPEHRSGRRIDIDLGTQSARLCKGANQVLTTPITSGASALGDATPTGTWHLQAKIRNTTLYPAAGGAYPVRYWMPYDGAYGIHDSSWQTFPYGSAKYRTQGSHGCVHFPRAAIAWMFAWAPVGTTVHIHD